MSIYKNIFLITTEDNDYSANQRKGFLLNKDIQQELLDKKNLFLFTHTVKTKKEEGMFDSEFKDSIFDQRVLVRNLNIYCKDGYSNLADKTFKSIKWIHSNLKFSYIIKCDDNKFPVKESVKTTGKDFSGCNRTKSRETDANGNSWWNKNAIKLELGTCKHSRFSRWAMNRKLAVDSEKFDPSVYYSIWKPYIISQKFAGVISKHGKNYAELYCKYLGGCEDHMVAKIFKDLQITYNLTVE